MVGKLPRLRTEAATRRSSGRFENGAKSVDRAIPKLGGRSRLRRLWADLSGALISLGVSFGGRSPVRPQARELKSLRPFSRMTMSFIMRSQGGKDQMSDNVSMVRSPEAERAMGRCVAALMFAVFGGLWLVLAAYAFARLDRIHIVAIVAGVAIFVITAVRLQRRGKESGAALPEDERKKREERLFGIVNAVQGLAIFLDFLLLPKAGYNEFTVPVAALIVGGHFFAVPPLYRHRANLVTGALLVSWTIVCLLLLRGDRMIAWVALGAGLIVWGSAAWALRTASRLLRLTKT